MSILQRTREGDRLPPRHRRVWLDRYRRETVSAPLGIHWIIRLWKRINDWTWRYNETARERELQQMWRSGYEQGHEHGLQQGRHDARAQGAP